MPNQEDIPNNPAPANPPAVEAPDPEPFTLPPPPKIKKGKWIGYREYISPNGDFVLYQPSLEELIAEQEKQTAEQGGGKTPPEQPKDAQDGHPPAKQANTPQPPSDGHPHTMTRDTSSTPRTTDGPPPTPPQHDNSGQNDDVDEEMRRHHEWLRHRMDPPEPPKPDPHAAGTYKRLRDEADETAARIRALEQERYDSAWPDWFWDQLFGAELRILLVHLRAVRWQIEEFEKAYANGDDPVDAVNRYNRHQWEIFLKALEEHIRLLGGAILGIEAVRAFQRAMEQALAEAQRARQQRANDWLRTRERAREAARKAGGPPEGGDPEGGPGPRPSSERTGGLTPRQWRNIKNRHDVNELHGKPEYDEALKRRLKEFGQDHTKGRTFGTVTLNKDGSVTVVSGEFSGGPDGDAVFSGPNIENFPPGEFPEGLEGLDLKPGVPEIFSIFNE